MPTRSKYRQEKIIAAVTSTAARQARPGAERSGLEVDADRDAVDGRKPANQ